MADVAVGDDWIFSWSARRFAAQGVVEVLPISGPNAVFEAFLGGIPGMGSSPSLGVLRLATVVLTGVSAIALWKLVEARCLRPVVRGLVVGAYLFNPLTMSLSFSFMTDAHALALTMIAIAFYDRGIRDATAVLFLLLGSMVAALAYLSRPQTLVVVVAVVVAGLFGKTRFTVQQLTASAVVPFVVVVGNWIWSGGTSPMQVHFLETLLYSNADEHLVNLVVAAATAVGFIGLFVAPVWVGRWRLSEMRSWAIRLVAPPFLMMMAYRGVFPFVDDWIGRGGLGAGPYFVYLSPDHADSGRIAMLWPIGLTVAAVLFSAAFFGRVARMFNRWPIDTITVFAGVGLATAFAGIVANSLFFHGAPP
ncbi:MAG: hypothetical protein OEX97_13040, partial [Acidimicrobiia bacterium]|nr:hypothetical protein [Acidimicrobiia bacterium]